MSSDPRTTMLEETKVKFEKYESRGAYHWEQISRSVRRHNAFTSARYEVILSALGKVQGQLLLDIGGGDGTLSYLIAERGAQTVTIDTAQMALRFAQGEFVRRRMTARTVAASAYTMPFPTGTFDAAACSDVIEHVQLPERLLAEAARVLRPGGRFVLTTPLRVTEKPLSPMHVQEFFPGELADLLSQAFSGVTVTAFAPLALLELYGLPFHWLGERPLFRYLFNAVAIYLGRNPFNLCAPFRYLSMLIATGRKN